MVSLPLKCEAAQPQVMLNLTLKSPSPLCKFNLRVGQAAWVGLGGLDLINSTYLQSIATKIQPLKVLKEVYMRQISESILLHVKLHQVPLVHEGIIRKFLNLVAI